MSDPGVDNPIRGVMVGAVAHRPPPSEPSKETKLRVEYLNWLVRHFGARKVGRWQDPPVTYEEWHDKVHRD